MTEKKSRFGGIFEAFKSTLYGMAGHDMTRYALKTRGSMEHLFILITMGDLLGIPILPPFPPRHGDTFRPHRLQLRRHFLTVSEQPPRRMK